jgi:ABC-2 type transport system ATP-binding protein
MKAAKNLSGGNKRKLCCAMALLSTPRIIFMDEASNGVDPISRKNLYTHLKRLRETSTLLITHRIDEAEKICDKIAIMADGHFLDLDHPDALKERHGVVYILQIEPSVAINVEAINQRIIMTLPFCKRVYSLNENENDEDRISFKPKLTYRFDEIEQYNRVSNNLSVSSNSNNGSFVEPRGKSTVDLEVRKKIVFMFKFVTDLMKEGAINDFSIYRSSLEQVFKKMVL